MPAGLLWYPERCQMDGVHIPLRASPWFTTHCTLHQFTVSSPVHFYQTIPLQAPLGMVPSAQSAMPSPAHHWYCPHSHGELRCLTFLLLQEHYPWLPQTAAPSCTSGWAPGSHMWLRDSPVRWHSPACLNPGNPCVALPESPLARLRALALEISPSPLLITAVLFTFLHLTVTRECSSDLLSSHWRPPPLFREGVLLGDSLHDLHNGLSPPSIHAPVTQLNTSDSTPPPPDNLSSPFSAHTIYVTPLLWSSIESLSHLSPSEALFSRLSVLSDVSGCANPQCWLPAGHGKPPVSLQQNAGSNSLHQRCLQAPKQPDQTQCSWSLPVKQSSTIQIKATVALYATLSLPGISNYSERLGLGHCFSFSLYSPLAHHSHKIHFTLASVKELHKTNFWIEYHGKKLSEAA